MVYFILEIAYVKVICYHGLKQEIYINYAKISKFLNSNF